MSFARSSLLPALTASVFALSLGVLSGCPGTASTGEPGVTPEAEPEPGPGEPEPGPGVSGCPDGVEGSNTACDLQNVGSNSYVGEGVEVTLRGVVATSPDFYISDTLRGFFVSDDPGAVYGGVLVTQLTAGAVTITQGDVVDITGLVKEFGGTASGTETQFESNAVTLAGGPVTIDPIAVADIGILTDPELGEPYEGVLVRLESVQIESIDLGFGQWSITDGTTTLVIENDIYSYIPADGEVLGSITGIMRYSTFDAGKFVLDPRSAADIESVSRPRTSIPQLLDSSVAGYIPPCPDGVFFGCGNAILEKMVVTSDPYFITTTSSRGPLFGFFVADPEAVDADGRLAPYSGVLVTMTPEDDTGDIERNDFDFAQETTFPYGFVNPDDVPNVGDVVNVRGQNSVRFGMPQFRFVSFLEKVGIVADVADVTMPLPAQFDPALPAADDRNPARLSGGRPAISAEAFGAALESPAIAADPAVTSWLGVMVEIVNATTTDACYGTPFNPDADDGGNAGVDDSYLRDFGYFKVSGDVEMGGVLSRGFAGYWEGDDQAANYVPVLDRTCENLANKCGDTRADAQAFTSVTGFMDISFDVFRFNPRTEADYGGIPFATDTCTP